MSLFLKWLFGVIGIIAGLFILILIIGLIGAASDGTFDETKQTRSFGKNFFQ